MTKPDLYLFVLTSILMAFAYLFRGHLKNNIWWALVDEV